MSSGPPPTSAQASAFWNIAALPEGPIAQAVFWLKANRDTSKRVRTMLEVDVEANKGALALIEANRETTRQMGVILKPLFDAEEAANA